MNIGEQLRNARLAKGLTLQDAEEATKIRSKYLEALENEQFDALPGKVYVIAFIRNYARYLGLDDNDLVQQYKEYSALLSGGVDEEETESNTQVRRRRVERKSKGKNWILAAAAAVLVIALATNLTNNDSTPNTDRQPNIVQQDENKETPEEQQDNNPADITEPDVNDDNEATVEGVQLVLNVNDAPCWMEINVDGQPAFSGIANPGEVKTYQGEERIYIKLGNAGAVDVEVNGENLGKLAGGGQVIEREFTAEKS